MLIFLYYRDSKKLNWSIAAINVTTKTNIIMMILLKSFISCQL